MKKSANGTGTFTKRPNGTWQYQIMLEIDSSGTKKRKSFYGKTKKEVLAKADKYKRDIADGIKVDNNITFERWSQMWLDGHKSQVSATTWEGYRYSRKLLVEHFGNMKLTDIKPIDVDRFVEKIREQGKSDSYLRKCRAMLFQIMHKAEANDLIRKNPVPFANKIRSTGAVKERECFSEEEVKQLMEKLPDDRMGNSIRILLGTGMRSQEILALEPRHIAEDGSEIRVEQAVKMVKGTPVIGETKSKMSNRTIPVPVGLRECVKKLRDTDNRFVWEKGVPGQPCNPKNFRDHFKKYIEAVLGKDDKNRTPHCCRHTYVSQMQSLGVDIETIRSLVGHVDIEMTEHYLKVQEKAKQNAIKVFDEGFF